MTSPTQYETAPSNAPADGADLTPAEAPTLQPPPTGVRPAHGEALAPSPTVRVEGLAETLQDVRHELHLLSRATKYNWINARLILLRNAQIAWNIEEAQSIAFAINVDLLEIFKLVTNVRQKHAEY